MNAHLASVHVLLGLGALALAACLAVGAGADPAAPPDKSAEIAQELKAAHEAAQEAGRVVTEASKEVAAVDMTNASVKAELDVLKLKLRIADVKPAAVVSPSNTNRPAVLVPSSGVLVVDNFKGGLSWLHEDWGDDGAVRLDSGKLYLDFTVGDKRKFAATKTFTGGLRVESSDKFIFDIDNPAGGGVSFAIGVFAGADYFESSPSSLKAGPNRVVFDMSARTFKCAATGWRNTASIVDALTTDRLTILIYARKQGSIAIDGVRLEKQ